MDGCVCVMVEEERYRVEQGDCIVFDANVEHVMYTEEQPATFVIIFQSRHTGKTFFLHMNKLKKRGAQSSPLYIFSMAAIFE